MDDENSIIHRKGQKLVVYFYSAYNKSTLSFVPKLLRFFEIDEQVRIVLINYDPKYAATSEIMDEITDANKFEFYSIDSGNLDNKHLQKYALNVLPKMLVVNKKGNVSFYDKPTKFDFECQEAYEKDMNMMISTQEHFRKERDAFLRFFGRLLESYSDILGEFIEYKIEFCERTWSGFRKLKTFSVNTSI
jgi:hypothetical protein